MIINTLWGEEEVKGKVCRICKVEKDISEFNGARNHNTTSVDEPRRSYCKTCYKKKHMDVWHLNQSPKRPKPIKCECCGKIPKSEKIYLDHDWNISGPEAFRGWLCNNCNIGIGKLGDNLDGVMKAVRYLKNDTF